MQKLSGTTAAILAGGLGTRLRSRVGSCPKVLAEVRGRPFLAFLLDRLASAGLRQVVLCTGYMSEQVQAFFGSSYCGMRLMYSQEEASCGTAGALRLALPLLESDCLLMMNGDSFCDADLRAFWLWHSKKPRAASLVLTELSNTQNYGRVLLDEDGLLLSFKEKPLQKLWLRLARTFLTQAEKLNSAVEAPTDGSAAGTRWYLTQGEK
ncbi:MAG: sugar phosphate nucleotidyltransferase [Acidobacteriota bacterium]